MPLHANWEVIFSVVINTIGAEKAFHGNGSDMCASLREEFAKLTTTIGDDVHGLSLVPRESDCGKDGTLDTYPYISRPR
jgi:hypothetical protein